MLTPARRHYLRRFLPDSTAALPMRSAGMCARRGPFNNWNPKIIQHVSPQVWASRPGRAHALAHDIDLLLSIFPFEKQWYAMRVPWLRVEFVGHPIVDRFVAARPQREPSPVQAEPALELEPDGKGAPTCHESVLQTNPVPSQPNGPRCNASPPCSCCRAAGPANSSGICRSCWARRVSYRRPDLTCHFGWFCRTRL